jgi:hypothetical protein
LALLQKPRHPDSHLDMNQVPTAARAILSTLN